MGFFFYLIVDDRSSACSIEFRLNLLQHRVDRRPVLRSDLRSGTTLYYLVILIRFDELLAPPSEDAAKLFAQFLSELNHFSDLGAKVYSEMQMAEKSLTITYYIPIASFSVIKDQIDELLEYRLKDKSGGINDFARDSFESKFSDDLKTYYNNIEDEIARYSDR